MRAELVLQILHGKLVALLLDGLIFIYQMPYILRHLIELVSKKLKVRCLPQLPF